MNVRNADDDAADALVTALGRLIAGDFDDLWRPWLTELTPFAKLARKHPKRLRPGFGQTARPPRLTPFLYPADLGVYDDLAERRGVIHRD
jgi:hypothetical protein